MAAATDSTYDHLATKGDLKQFKFQLLVGFAVGLSAATGIILAAMRLWM